MHDGIGGKNRKRSIEIARVEGLTETLDNDLVTFG
jgi:hypothetical protein